MTYKKTAKENLEKRHLSELPFLLAHLEKRAYDMMKLGMTANKDKPLKRIREKRNLCRKVLLNKLNDWKKNGIEELTISDILERSDDFEVMLLS